jgi:hypothetical protein
MRRRSENFSSATPRSAFLKFIAKWKLTLLEKEASQPIIDAYVQQQKE